MDLKRAAELMNIEKQCVKRASTCDRDCAKCELVQEDSELIEAFSLAEYALRKLDDLETAWNTWLKTNVPEQNQVTLYDENKTARHYWLGMDMGAKFEAEIEKQPIHDGYYLSHTSRNFSPYCTMVGGCYVCMNCACPWNPRGPKWRK